jgi:serine/threonine protein kinase
VIILFNYNNKKTIMSNEYCVTHGNCTNCLTKQCVETFNFLQETKFDKVIGLGHQGLVINALYKNKEIAIKFEILNSYPVTMTTRKGINCNSLWFKIPGIAKLVQKYLEFDVRNLKLYKNTTVSDFEKECELAQKIGELKAGPTVLFHTVCRQGLETAIGLVDVGILAMEKYSYSLRYFVSAMLEYDVENFKKSLQYLHQIFTKLRSAATRLSNFIHGDLHADNVLINTTMKHGKPRFKIGIIDFGVTSIQSTDEYAVPISIEVEQLILYIKSELLQIRFKIPPTIAEYVKLFQYIQKI